MKIIMYEYPKCGTCRKAKKYLEDQGISFETNNLVENPPTRAEIEQWTQKSDLPIRKFFNTSGKKYRELELSKKMHDLTDAEKIDLLASDGMLIKRPVVTNGKKVTVGFKESTFDEVWNNKE